MRRAEYFLKLANLIEERSEELARTISEETGKTYNESIAEVNEALHMAQYAFSTGRMPYGEAIASELPDLLLRTRTIFILFRSVSFNNLSSVIILFLVSVTA